MEVFLLFVLYSFFGCVLEDAYYFLLHGRYVSKQTMLTLPLCPVYGAAAIVLAAVNNTKSPVLLFVNGFLAVSAVELGFYLVSERLYGIKWWDYSHLRVNLFGGVSLFYSCMWGLLNILFGLYAHPVCAAWVHHLGTGEKMLAGVFAAVYFLADLKQTHKELIKYKNGIKSLVTEKFQCIRDNN